MTPLARYSFAVLVPVAIGVLAGLWATTSAFQRWQKETDLRVAASATDLILQEMGATRDALLKEAVAVEPTPPYPPQVEAALRGDTVLAMGSSEESLELTVAYGEGSMVRIATGPFRPTVLEVLPSITGYRLALYLRGTRTVTTEPPFSPEVLHPEVLLTLARQADGMVIESDGVTGALRAFQAVPGRPSDVAVMATAEDDTRIQASGTTAPVTVLIVVLLLSGFAAWTTHHPRHASAPDWGQIERSTLQWSLVVLVPVIAGSAILLSFDRDFRQGATTSMREQLSRAIILVKQVDRLSSASASGAITGFEAARLRAGVVEATTRDEPDLIEALRQLRPPPPNFTSSGTLAVDDGTRFYSAARTPNGATLVLIGPVMEVRWGEVRRALGLAGLLILLPPLLFLWFSEHPRSELISEESGPT